jgi:hypothetical protein
MSKIISSIDELGYSSIESETFQSDVEELEVISKAIPKDNILSQETCKKLQRLCIRGMNICDNWVPRLHIIISEQESERDKAKNIAYVNAKLEDNVKLTAEMRKAISELDATYNEIKNSIEKLKGMKFFFEKRRDTLKSSIYVFKEQMSSYTVSDKGNDGEELYSISGSSNKSSSSYDDNKNGKINL